MLLRKSRISILTVLTVLVFSAFTPALAYGAPLANDGKDWQNQNGNSWGWNYSPQTQINKDNVQNLEVKWVFPIGAKAQAPAALQPATLREGVTAPILIHDGAAVALTNYLRAVKIDMKTGRVVWTNEYNVNVTKERENLPLQPASGLHLHGTRYWEAGNMILQLGLICDFYGIDFNTGKQTFRVPNLCVNIPGNVYKYQNQLMGAGQSAVGVWDKGRQFIYSLQGSLQGDFVSGRMLFEGIDMDSKQVVWRVFNQPPQDVPAKDWALQECDIGYFVTTPCSAVAAKDRTLLEYDWQAVPGEPTHRLNGVSASWSYPIVDEDTGIMYIQTGNQSPYSNATFRPGPSLYGSTIMAINMAQGKRIWWVQPYPHDPYDKDCNWSGMLIDHPQLGKVYLKGCKDGYMYVIDAKTGKPLNRWDVVVETYGKDWRSYIIYDPAGVVPGSPNSWDGFKEMLTLPWPGAGKMEVEQWARIDPTTVLLRPGVSDFAADPSYDGENTIYYKVVIGESRMGTIDLEQAASKGAASWLLRGTGKVANVTLVARDLVTGKVKWSWGPVTGSQRGLASQLAITGGLAVVPYNADQSIWFFDKDTGKVLHKMNMGAGMLTGPSVGKDSDGNSMILLPVGVGPSATGPINPGVIVAIGLSARAAAEVKTTTVTTTSVTTSVTTSISTSTTTSATTSTVTSATTQTVTTTSATTSTTTKATTVVSTQPAQTQTTTVTSQVTQTTGLPAEVTYAAVAVAILAIIGAAVLVMRKK